MDFFNSTSIIAFATTLVVLGACADSAGDNQPVLTPYEDAAATEDVDAGTGGSAPEDASNGADAELNGDAEPDGAPGSDADPQPDASPNVDVGNGGEFCQPVGDGIIRRDRYSLQPGQSAPFKFSLDVSVDTEGQVIDGTRTWDLAEPHPEDFVDEVSLDDPGDHWFGEEFPDATYASPLSAGNDDEFGIFEVTDDALLMVGVASPDDGYYRTELRYDPPVTILPFPFEEGDSWETETRATGSYSGNHVHGHDETYRSEVDATGDLITPYGTFPVLRVNTHLTREVWMGWFTSTTEVRTHAFATECFGTVARITSEEDEADDEFSHAAEVMRLTQ